MDGCLGGVVAGGVDALVHVSMNEERNNQGQACGTLFDTCPLMLATRTMLPVVFVFTFSRAVACAMRNVPVTFISSIRRNDAAGKSVEGPFSDSPAHATSPFMGYRRVGTNLTKASVTAFSSVTSREQ